MKGQLERGVAGFLADARAWTAGRSAIWRLPLWLYLVYAGICHLRDVDYSSFLFGGVTFGVHELGHVVFSPFGQFLGVAGGSLAQVLAPLLVGWGFLFWQRDGEPQRDYFALSVALCWLSFSLQDLARYVGDARTQELPLLGLTADPLHDWAYLLQTLGLLEYDHHLAGLIRLLALGVGLAALTLGAWLLRHMAWPPSPTTSD